MTAPGVLMAIGGAEDKLGPGDVLRRFVALAGGPAARIVVIGTASELGPAVLDIYRLAFERLDAGTVVGIRPTTRAEAAAPDVVSALEEATGVFLTGGNQLRLGTIVVGTPLAAAIGAAHSRGAVVAGTSAGAGALSEHMMSFGASGAVPRHRMSQLSAGLGLLPGVIVDQHFTQRNRIGRLLSLVASSPGHLGMGVDEDTAAVIGPDGVMEVVGRGTVTLVDGRDLTTDVPTAKRNAPLLVSGAVLHTLPTGARFSISQRRLLASTGVDRTVRRRAAE